MNFKALLEWSVARHRDRVAVVFEDVERTYGEVDARACRLANGLRELGVGRGDRVVLCLGNRAEHFDADIAVTKLGAVKVPILTRSTTKELLRYMETLQPAAVIVAAAAVERVREARERYDGELTVITVDEPGPGELRLEDLVQGSADAAIDLDIAPEELYAVRLTGGTTGVPKGVMMDHRCAVTMTNNMLLNLPVERDDAFLSIHPLSHACGNFSGAYWARGASNVVLPDFGFSPEAFVDALDRHGVTSTFTIPTALYRLLDSEALVGADLSRIRLVLYGAAPIAQTRLRQAVDRFGPVFAQLYGSTESPMFTVLLPPEEHVFDTDPPPARLRSAGRVILNAELRVIGEDGEACESGEIGEIQARGDHTMAGYWANEELTARRKVDGWVLTGDLGYFDDDGYLFLVDRREDMIITGGFNVWPAEVEDVLYSHPAVAEAAVFGLPDDYWGEMVVGAVVPKPGAHVTEEEMLAHLAERLVKYKVPKRVVVGEEPLPKSEAGKLLRREARDRELARLVEAG